MALNKLLLPKGRRRKRRRVWRRVNTIGMGAVMSPTAPFRRVWDGVNSNLAYANAAGLKAKATDPQARRARLASLPQGSPANATCRRAKRQQGDVITIGPSDLDTHACATQVVQAVRR